MSSLDAASLFGVKGLVAVITGGGTGIGLMMAKALEHNGAKVYIIGRRLETLQTAAKEAVCSSRLPNSLTYSPMVRNTATSSLFKGT
jgi:NADP-dependent 3-hydroxy acid dehydrogenase YdfG